MPVYEYECEECGKQASHLLSADRSEAVECPACGGTELHRLVSRFSRGRFESDRVREATDRLATADDTGTGQALAEVGRAHDEDLSEAMATMYEADQDGA